MWGGVRDDEPDGQVLPGVQEDEKVVLASGERAMTMEREDVLGLLQSISARAELDPRDLKIIDLRFGISGERLVLKEIGKRLDPPVTRQRVHVLVNGIRNRIGPVWDQLEVIYPEPTTETALKRMYRSAKMKIDGYLRSVGPDDTLVYGEIHEVMGVPIPSHREAKAFDVGEIESCQWLYEDYDFKFFGRYRRCSTCHEIKLCVDEGNQFYRVQTAGRSRAYVYQLCKPCNTDRCVASARERTARGTQ